MELQLFGWDRGDPDRGFREPPFQTIRNQRNSHAMDGIGYEGERWSGWVVATTGSNFERVASASLSAAGFTNWLPEYFDWRGRARILFSNYILVLASWNNWKQIYRAKKVSRILLSDGKPSLVRPRAMEQMRARANEEGVLVLPTRFEINARVRITEGPWIGNIGLYQGMDRKHRELVLLSLLGREVKVPVDYNSVVPAAS